MAVEDIVDKALTFMFLKQGMATSGVLDHFPNKPLGYSADFLELLMCNYFPSICHFCQTRRAKME
jgi:hypothetical protein